jgi:hypothetical protein
MERTPGDKLVSFHVRVGTQNRWVKSRAMIDTWGFYQDAKFIYLQDGNYIRRNLLSSPIEEYIEDETLPGKNL